MVKNIRLEIAPRNKKVTEDKTVYDILRDIQYEEWKALNKCMTLLYADTQGKMILKGKGEPVPSDKQCYGKTLRGYLYDICKEDMVTPSTHITANVSSKALDQFKKDKLKGLLKGNCSLSTFRRDVPIFIPAPAVNIEKGNKGYEIELALLNRGSSAKYGLKSTDRFVFDVVKTDGNKSATLDKIIDGAWKLGGVSVSHKDRKWYIHISFHFDGKDVSGTKIMGLDLGIHNAAAISIYDPESDKHERMSYKEALIPGGVVEEVRKQFQKRRWALGNASRLNRSGKGYDRKNKKLLELRNKESNFRNTYNHKLSKYIVDLAVKRGVGLIQMEDLSGGFGDKFLKDWAYYDLQEKITYKASENGIGVTKIDPKYTTRRCSYCGVIDFGVNDTSIHEWTCKCGKRHNRDINAAMNIAIPDIEKIIDFQLEAQKAA